MATKYCIDWLRNKTIAYLSRYSPHTLRDWIRLCQRPEGTHPQEYIPHPVLIINLARSANAPILLPMALYRIGREPAAELINLSLSSPKGPIPPSMYRLSTEDVYNCLRYQQRRLASAYSILQSIESHHPSAQCSTLALCPDALTAIASNIRSRFLDISLPPLGFIMMGKSVATNSGRLCSHCRKNFITFIDDKVNELWEELPSWFDLSSWDVLTSDFVPENEI
ncbi:hypothetical protein BU17DRAFT_51274 [Hysterangium stoloniferum]|nr:hypothetical protein BU17DRAFT_51274 [Hysterangium stoloniferum]